MNNSMGYRARLVYFVALSLLMPACVFASTTNGTLDPAYNNLAWSENVGWINLNPPQGNAQITDNGMTGYAWSDSYGWINLAPAGSGIQNDGEGHLSGYAWGENLGWIGFSGITIDANGIFHGISTGDITGTVNFDCSACHVVTDWRPLSARNSASTPAASTNGGGAAPPETFLKPVPPSGGFTLLVNGVAGTSTVEARTVSLTLNAGTDVDRMAISNTSDFAKVSLVPYTASTPWDLCSHKYEPVKSKECKPGAYHIYAKFYTKYGLSSDPIMATAILQAPLPGQVPLVQEIQEAPQVIQAPQTSPTLPPPTYNIKAVSFPKNLGYGFKHPDVKRLQQFLNLVGFIVSQRGFGSPGHETDEFGWKTYQALVRFQKANVKQIFTSRPAVKNDFGRFGPLTRQYVNSLIGADGQK